MSGVGIFFKNFLKNLEYFLEKLELFQKKSFFRKLFLFELSFFGLNFPNQPKNMIFFQLELIFFG